MSVWRFLALFSPLLIAGATLTWYGIWRVVRAVRLNRAARERGIIETGRFLR